ADRPARVHRCTAKAPIAKPPRPAKTPANRVQQPRAPARPARAPGLHGPEPLPPPPARGSLKRKAPAGSGRGPRGLARSRLLLLLGRDHHHHLATFEARTLLDDHLVTQVGLDLGGHRQTELLMGHFAPLE